MKEIESIEREVDLTGTQPSQGPPQQEPQKGKNKMVQLKTSDPRRVLEAYADLVTQNVAIPVQNEKLRALKLKFARDAGELYCSEISPRLKAFGSLEIAAADNISPPLGTLAGSVVAQRCLDLFRYQYPVLNRVYQDFSEDVGYLNAPEITRVLIVPGVQTFNPAVNPDTGLPWGWSPPAGMQSVDVSVTLSQHIGVPLVFDANMLAATMRRLFEEFPAPAANAIAKQFAQLVYGLATPANFAAYSTVNPPGVPVARAYYPVALGDFGRGTLAEIGSLFGPNHVPTGHRSILCTSPYFAKLASDPSLVAVVGQKVKGDEDDIELAKASTFLPLETPDLTSSNPTPNLAAFACHRSAIVVKSRVPFDMTGASGGRQLGRAITVLDPETGLSALAVEYVEHSIGIAVWRLEAIIGAAVGDARGGLCITSQ